jgi:GTPase SAR1 family protein
MSPPHGIHLISDILLSPGDAAVGKSSLLVRLTDQRFLANPDPTVRLLPYDVPLYFAEY